VIDRSYRIQAWNRKREIGLQGVSREEAIGRTIFEILHRQPAEVLRGEFERVFESGEMQQFPIESSAFGEARAYRITKIPMHLDNKDVSHVITIGEDITDWRRAEQRFAQAEKLAAIGTLAAGVMHEINNPLATIGACAETLSLAMDEGTVVVQRGGGEAKESLSLASGSPSLQESSTGCSTKPIPSRRRRPWSTREHGDRQDASPRQAPSALPARGAKRGRRLDDSPGARQRGAARPGLLALLSTRSTRWKTRASSRCERGPTPAVRRRSPR
jgi:PAS domain S-box-containing protein